jgi:hypothetical protein
VIFEIVEYCQITVTSIKYLSKYGSRTRNKGRTLRRKELVEMKCMGLIRTQAGSVGETVKPLLLKNIR